MTRTAHWLALAPLAVLLALFLGVAAAWGGMAPSEVREDWYDTSRKRTVPVLLRLPADTRGPLPVIVFSHGLGGSREGYAPYGRYWASRGYACVHLQHPGSDSSILDPGNPANNMRNMRKAMRDLTVIRDRPLDVRFAADRLEALNRSGPLKGRFDLARMGMGGHSFGAWTTLAVVGERFNLPGGRSLTLSDPRYRAALAMSAPIPRKRDPDSLRAAYGSIRVPVFLMTGTEDTTPLDSPGVDASMRRLPFDGLTVADRFLLVLTGADHMTFGANQRSRAITPDTPARSPHLQDLIQEASTAFWDAYLKGDPAARDQLRKGPLRQRLEAAGVFEAP